MTETLCVSGTVADKAGANANTTILASGTAMTRFINQAESTISVVSRKDWVNLYSGLSANYKQILEDTCSSLAAIPVISYDMSGYTSRYEAETMLDMNRDIALRGMSLLKNAPQKTFLESGAGA